MKVNRDNLLGLIMDFEDGTIEYDDFIDLFQYLIDSGEVWTLQGRYGQVATFLIKEGVCYGVGRCKE